jgi:hypothetical protein
MKAVINRPRSGQIEMKGLLAALPEQVTRQFMPTAFSVYSGSLAGKHLAWDICTRGPQGGRSRRVRGNSCGPFHRGLFRQSAVLVGDARDRMVPVRLVSRSRTWVPHAGGTWIC